MNTIDMGVKTPDLHAIRAGLVKKLNEGQAALVLLDKVIEKEGSRDEAPSN